MKTPASYFIQRNGTEEGPFTVAQINRMKQKGAIAAATPCRPASETAFSRVDVLFPHLKDGMVDRERVAQVTRSVRDYEVKSLIGLCCLAPVGFVLPTFRLYVTFGAFGAGVVLLFKYRHPAGLLGIAVGVIGFYLLFMIPHVAVSSSAF